MKTITITPTIIFSPCEIKHTTASDSDTVSTGVSSASIENQSITFLFSSDKHHATSSSSPPTPPRRSIFNSYWQKHSSSISTRDDDSGSEGWGPEAKRSPKLDPSYLGIYSFAPSPLPSPNMPELTLSPTSSTESLISLPVRPKSILRRHRSLLPRRFPPVHGRPNIGIAGQPSGASCVGPESNTNPQFDTAPHHQLQDDASEVSDLSLASSSSQPGLKCQHSSVHFDPTITVRECVGGDPKGDQESNWFSGNELQTFMAETVDLCYSSAVNAVRTYSSPAMKKAYESAYEVGVKRPILSSNPSFRALFAEPVLHATDEDFVVHDGSEGFFKILSQEIQRVLIVDNSLTSRKLFHRQILSMFPRVQIDTAASGEDALDRIEVDTKRAGLNYDLIIVEERLQQSLPGETDSLSGSELLRQINEMESSTSFHCNGNKQERGIKPGKILSRRCLKIGVSVSLGEDCESLRNEGGADLFWSKPPPKSSNGLRNQVMNALLSKRGDSVFVCGC